MDNIKPNAVTEKELFMKTILFVITSFLIVSLSHAADGKFSNVPVFTFLTEDTYDNISVESSKPIKGSNGSKIAGHYRANFIDGLEVDLPQILKRGEELKTACIESKDKHVDKLKESLQKIGIENFVIISSNCMRTGTRSTTEVEGVYTTIIKNQMIRTFNFLPTTNTK